jgi:hypothetical protein
MVYAFQATNIAITAAIIVHANMVFNPVGIGRLAVIVMESLGFESKLPAHHQSDIIETGIICMKEKNRQDGQKSRSPAATKYDEIKRG